MAEFFEDTKLTLVKAATVAGTTAVNSDSVDMSGYDAVVFFTTFGVITVSGVQSIKCQQSSDDGVADAFADITGTSVTVADDDDGQVFGVQLIRPQERYVRLVVSRSVANAVVGEIYALQLGGDVRPITNTVTNIATFETHADAIAGTA